MAGKHATILKTKPSIWS